MMNVVKKTERSQLHLRFRENSDLLKRLENAAALSGRGSVTAEVIYRLEQSLNRDDSEKSEVELLRDEVRQLGMRLWDVEKKVR